MRIISRLFLVLLGAVVVLLALANRAPVTINLEPLPFVIETPLFVALLALFALGFIVGAGGTWWSGRARRKEARQWRRHAKSAALEAPGGKEPAPPQLPSVPLSGDPIL